MNNETPSARAGDGNSALAQRITDYLASGGLFNPEMANHDAVRDLLIECRDALAAAPAAAPGLTDKQIHDIGETLFHGSGPCDSLAFARAVIAADRAALAASRDGLPVAIVTRFNDVGGEVDWTGVYIGPVGAKLYADPTPTDRERKDALRFRWLIDSRNFDEGHDTPMVCTSEDVHWGDRARSLIDRHMETK